MLEFHLRTKAEKVCHADLFVRMCIHRKNIVFDALALSEGERGKKRGEERKERKGAKSIHKSREEFSRSVTPE